MPVQLTCACGYSAEVADVYAGRSVKCPRCKTSTRVERSAVHEEPPAFAPIVEAATGDPAINDWRQDTWGIIAVALAAFSLGFLICSSALLAPFAAGAAAAGLVCALVARFPALQLGGLFANFLFLMIVVITTLASNSRPPSLF